MTFVVLETVLKVSDVSVRSPQILGTLRLSGKLVCSRALITTILGSLKPILEVLRPRLGVLRLRRVYIGNMTHWITGKQIILRSLVAPTRGAAGFLLIN